MEVIGRRRKTKRIERIFRCVDSVSVGIYNELLTVKLYYCHRILLGLLRISVWSRVDICSFCRGILYVWASGLCSLHRGFVISSTENIFRF